MSDGPRRQVLPSVNEGHELMGYPVNSLLRLYMPALGILFGAINFAPDGWTAPIFAIGIVVAIITTGLILASPSGISPAEYAHDIYQTYTGQDVTIHE